MESNDDTGSRKRWLKAELHTHCSLDPVDYKICSYSPEQLLTRAAEQGYEVLAFTCHNRDIWTDRLCAYALRLGITLIPGMEVTAEGSRHVLVYNFHEGPETLNTLAKIGRNSRKDTLVIAPHAFYPGRVCLRGLLYRHSDVFDALEYSGFHVRGINFNRRSADFAIKTGKPLVGCSDVHYLWQLDKTCTWINAEPDVSSIVSAVKRGDVRIETAPLSWREAAGWWITALRRFAFPANAAPYRPAVGRLTPVRDAKPTVR